MKKRHDSYLAQAIALDKDLYRATQDQPRSKGGRPELVEYDLTVSLLTTLVEQMQQLIGFTAGQKKPKVKKLPRPVTAQQLVAREDAKQAYQNVMSILRFEDAQGGE